MMSRETYREAAAANHVSSSSLPHFASSMTTIGATTAAGSPGKIAVHYWIGGAQPPMVEKLPADSAAAARPAGGAARRWPSAIITGSV